MGRKTVVRLKTQAWKGTDRGSRKQKRKECSKVSRRKNTTTSRNPKRGKERTKETPSSERRKSHSLKRLQRTLFDCCYMYLERVVSLCPYCVYFPRKPCGPVARATAEVIAAAPAAWAASICGVRVCLERSATLNPAAAPPNALLNQSF
ncbi:unnamed protein product, partial [Ectocarpus fasciculatus]